MRRRALALLLALAALAGCGWSGADDAAITSGGVVDGDILTVYSSLPGPGRGAAADIVAGEKLALADRGGRVGRFPVNFVSVDEAGGRKASAEAARAAIADNQAVAVIGGLRTPETRTTAPLLNAAGYLQVVLGASYPGFTRPGVHGEPGRYKPAAQPTFARVSGDAGAEAEALVAAAIDPRPRFVTGPAGTAPAGRSLAVAGAAASDEARALAAAVRAAARRAGLRLTADPARAGAVVYVGPPGRALDTLARATPRARLVLPEALGRAGVRAPRAVTVASAPAPPPGFAARYRAAFGRAPGLYSPLGYAAMDRVLDAIAAAGDQARTRRQVIRAFTRTDGGGAPRYAIRPAGLDRR
jgi:ABC-type branched-subunit amino acid transport system substrate-binding protein